MQPRLQSESLNRHNSKIGTLGEDIAEHFLRSLYYTILSRNFHTHYGELDIIARDGKTLVFVEVKTRTGNTYGSPEDAITPKKLHDVIRAAEYYLLAHPLVKRNFRIDVVAILLNHDTFTVQDLRHCKNVTM